MPLLKKVLYILSFLGLFYVLQKASAIASPEGSHLFTDFLSAQNYEMGEGCTEKAARFAPTFEKWRFKQ